MDIEREKPMKVFISGKMTGVVGYNHNEFNKAESYLQHYGHIVLNPAVLPIGMERHDYMVICYAMVEVADAVYVLRNSEDSIGSQEEVRYATAIGKKIYEQE
jgi:hypothetical protein